MQTEQFSKAATEAPVSADFVPAYATLTNPDSWSARNRHLFRSDVSFRWFVRMHQAELIDSGALVKIAGRWFVHTPRWAEVFTTCAIKDSQRAIARVMPPEQIPRRV